MQKSELELGRMRGKLLDAEDVRQLWGELASMVSQRLQSIAAKVAPRAVMIGLAPITQLTPPGCNPPWGDCFY